MKENPYAAPKSDAGPGKPNWLKCRPIPVFLIAALCSLQMIGTSLVIYMGRDELMQLVHTGSLTPLAFAGKLIAPLMILTAGILLLLMRKAATYTFAAYLAWVCSKFFIGTSASPGALDLVMVSCMLAYCLHLHRTGRLS